MNDFTVNFAFDNPLRVKLPSAINLAQYEVSVTQLSLPSRYYNAPDCKIEYSTGEQTFDKMFPAGYYETNAALVSQINNLLDRKAIELSYDDHRQRAAVHIKQLKSTITFPRFLAHRLNLPSSKIESTAVSSAPMSVNGPQEICILTCNFVQPSILNAGFVNLLAITPVQNSNCTVLPYIPTRGEHFEYFMIDILNMNLLPMRFIGGKALLSLHFRKRP